MEEPKQQEMTTKPAKPDPGQYLNPTNVAPLPPWDESRDLIRLTEVPSLLRRLYSYRVSNTTVSRWVFEGLVDDDGNRVYLPTKRFAGRIYVDKESLIEFCLGDYAEPEEASDGD